MKRSEHLPSCILLFAFVHGRLFNSQCLLLSLLRNARRTACNDCASSSPSFCISTSLTLILLHNAQLTPRRIVSVAVQSLVSVSFHLYRHLQSLSNPLVMRIASVVPSRFCQCRHVQVEWISLNLLANVNSMLICMFPPQNTPSVLHRPQLVRPLSSPHRSRHVPLMRQRAP